MSIDNVEVTTNVTNVVVTPVPATNLLVTQQGPINVEVAYPGPVGAPGPAPTIDSTVPVTTVAPVTNPSASVTGSNPYTINLTLPVAAQITSGAGAPAGGTGQQGFWYINTSTWDMYEKTGTSTWTNRLNIRGATGSTGNTGPAPNLTSVVVTTGAAGSSGSGSFSGTNPNYTLNLTIPRGDTGATGPAPTLNASIPVTTLAPTASPTASVTGSNPYTINLSLPVAPQWRSGSGAPAGGLGLQGDWYQNTGPAGIGDVYEKTAVSTWTLRYNIRGAAGSGSTSASPGTIGNVVLYAATDGSLLSDAGFAGTDIGRLSATQSWSGIQVYTNRMTMNDGTSGIQLRNVTDQTKRINVDLAAITTATTRTVSYPDITGTFILDAGTQTLTGAKTFSALLTASAGVTVTGTVTATTFSGSGASLTSLPAGNLTGTAPIGVIPTGTTGTTVALGNHNHDTSYVALTGAQTVGGAKTFSALITASAGVTVTGTVTATTFSGSGASLTSIPAGQLTGTAPIGVIPTGTTGTTVALGNHTHAGVYEPVITAGSVGQYWRGDKSWQTLNIAAVSGLQAALDTKPAWSTDDVSDGSVAAWFDAGGGAFYVAGAGFSVTDFVTLQGSAVLVTGTQTVGGAKTFSSLVTASAGLTVTGTVTATTFSGSGASLTSLPAGNLTGTVPIGTIPTGTTGTTVALGNHTHSGYVDTTTTQSIAGNKTFTGSSVFNIASSGAMSSPITITNTGTGAGTAAAFMFGTVGAASSLKGAVIFENTGVGNGRGNLHFALDNTADTSNATIADAVLTFVPGGAATFVGAITAPSFSGSGASLTALNGSNISTGTVAQARMVPNVQQFNFTTGSEARPTGSTYVMWVGPVTPTNAINGDIWVDTP